MDLKLIEKLARLANNNPNEHEANAAARKVCKLLQENNFNFGLNIERTTFDHSYKQAEKFYQNDPFFNAGSQYKYGGQYGNQQKKPEKKQRERTCVSCGKTVMTKRITNIFKCDKCEWDSYIKPFTDHL